MKKVGYKGIHMWLFRTYGKAFKCQNRLCDSTCKVFEWSLKNGRKLLKKRKSFWMLCRDCHKEYDRKTLSKKISKKWKNGAYKNTLYNLKNNARRYQFTSKDRKQGGKNCVKNNGKKYMQIIGTRGRKNQLSPPAH